MKQEKLALITGASRGLGAGLAEVLSQTHHVLAVARTVGGLEELDDQIRSLGGRATLVPLDLTEQGAIAGLAQAIAGRWGQIDVWAHTVVYAPPLAPADHLAEKDWAKALKFNAALTGQLIGALAPFLGAEGHALFFDDEHVNGAFSGAYAASKAAQITLVHKWQMERARLGPNIHILTPQPMPTALRAKFYPGEDRSVLAHPRDEAKRLWADVQSAISTIGKG